MKIKNVDYIEEEEVYEKKVKLVTIPDDQDGKKAWVVNFHDDWIHDHYDGSTIYYGTIYSPFESFFPLTTQITGYFRDDDTKKWIKVDNGIANLENDGNQVVWWDSLEDLIRLELTQLDK